MRWGKKDRRSSDSLQGTVVLDNGIASTTAPPVTSQRIKTRARRIFAWLGRRKRLGSEMKKIVLLFPVGHCTRHAEHQQRRQAVGYV